MALTITGYNPIVVTGTTDASSLIYSGKCFIQTVHWHDATAVGHQVHLHNGDGDPIIGMIASVGNSDEDININIQVVDIYCDDFDSGTLYIFLR